MTHYDSIEEANWAIDLETTITICGNGGFHIGNDSETEDPWDERVERMKS